MPHRITHHTMSHCPHHPMHHTTLHHTGLTTSHHSSSFHSTRPSPPHVLAAVLFSPLGSWVPTSIVCSWSQFILHLPNLYSFLSSLGAKSHRFAQSRPLWTVEVRLGREADVFFTSPIPTPSYRPFMTRAVLDSSPACSVQVHSGRVPGDPAAGGADDGAQDRPGEGGRAAGQRRRGAGARNGRQTFSITVSRPGEWRTSPYPAGKPSS